MNITNGLCCVFASSILFTSCFFNSKEKPPVVINPSLLDTIFSNTYQGVIPCPDCQGIETNIQIFNDSTITRTVYYNGKNEFPQSKLGTWKLIDSVFEATFDREKLFYKIKDFQTILRVGSDLREIKGKIASNYTFNKVSKFSSKAILGTYQMGDSVKGFKKLTISNLPKSNYQLTFEKKSISDTLQNCTFDLKASFNNLHHLQSDLKNLKDSLEGTLQVVFTNSGAHLFVKDFKADNDTLFCIKSKETLEGIYLKDSIK